MCHSVVEKEFLLSLVLLLAFFVSLLFWVCSFAVHVSFLSFVAAHGWLAFKTFRIEYMNGCTSQQCDSVMASLHTECPDRGSVKSAVLLRMASVPHFHCWSISCLFNFFFFFNLTLLLWLEHWPSLHRLQLASLLVASFSFLQPAVEAHLLPSLTCLFCIHLWLFSFGHQFPFLFISHFISSLLLSRRFLSHASGLSPRNFAWSVLKLRCARFRLWISDCDRLSFFHGVLVAYRDIAGEEVPGKLHLCRDLYLPLLR